MGEHLLMIICFLFSSILLAVEAYKLWNRGIPISAFGVFLIALIIFGSAVDEAMILIGGI